VLRRVRDCCEVAQVTANGDTVYAKSFDFSNGFERLLRRIEISNSDVRSGTSERQSDLATDPARCASD